MRISEYESIETALSLKGKINWIWVDCFSKLPINTNDFIRLKKAKFKLCLVSPELQGRDPNLEIPKLKNKINKLKIKFNAVCTKRPELWEI